MPFFKIGGKNGQTINLVESQDMVVVRTRGNRALREAGLNPRSLDIMGNMEEVVTLGEAGVSVFRVKEERGLVPRSMRDEARSVLKEDDALRFAGRVLQYEDSGVPVVYTENLFVKFLDDIPQETCEKILGRFQLQIKEKLAFAPNAYFTGTWDGIGMDVLTLSNRLLNANEVEYCHPELVSQRLLKAIHPLQWHLKQTTVGGRLVNAHANVEAAWPDNRGENTIIAVIDDGVDVSHPELTGKIVFPRDTYRNSDDVRPLASAEDSHGTCCAGVAAGKGLNNGASGVAPAAQIMPIRCGNLGSRSEAEAFKWAADHGADVISCSWGPADGDWENPNDSLHTRFVPMADMTRLAIDYAVAQGRKGKGCVILFAAGNGREDVKYDGYASYSKVLAISACNDQSGRVVYSDFGDAVWCAFPSRDFGYPRFNHPSPLTSGIRTAAWENGASTYTNKFGGTSSACPGAAGTVALMLSANPNLNWQQVRDILKATADKIDQSGGTYDAQGHSLYFGYGRVNAAKAVAAARATVADPQQVSLTGQVLFSNGAIPAATGKWIEPAQAGQKLLGLSLKLQNQPAGLQLRYAVIIRAQGAVSNGGGGFAGTTDKRRSVVGFHIRLSGPGAEAYDVTYSAKILNSATIFSGKNGNICGSLDPKKGKTITAIQVFIKKK